jgi:outer membrane protein, protease secretion system
MKLEFESLKGRSRTAVVAACLLTGAGLVWPMDLMQAYEAAKKQDATVRAARAAADAGRERLPQARAQLMPNISLSLTQNSNHLSSTTPNFLGREQTTNSDYGSGSQTLTIRQPLYRTYLSAQYRQAAAEVDNTNALLAQEEQGLPVRLSGAYFEALLTSEQLALVLAQRTAYTTQLDAARKTFAAGSGTRTDIDEAQSRLDMALAQEFEARENVDYTLRQLQLLVNEPVNRLAPLVVTQLDLSPPQPNRLGDWIERAEQHSPQLQALRARLEASRLELDKARSGHYPTLDAIVQFSRSESENVTNIASRYNNAAIGLQLNMPIYGGGYVSSLVRQALAGIERATEELEAGRRDLGLRVHREFRGMTESIPKIRALEQAAKSADQLVISSRRSVQAGSRTVLDVLNAEQQRTVVLRDLAQARFLYLMARIRLLSLVGAADDLAMQHMNRALQP